MKTWITALSKPCKLTTLMTKRSQDDSGIWGTMINKVPDSQTIQPWSAHLAWRGTTRSPLTAWDVPPFWKRPQRRSWVLHGSMGRVSYGESIHLGSLNFLEIPICLYVVTVVTQRSSIQKDQKRSSLFINLSLFTWAWAMSQSFDHIYFEATSEIWRFWSLIISSNGSMRRCFGMK